MKKSNLETILLKTELETKKFASEFAQKIKWPQLIALHGDLGSGKTTFVRAFIQSLCGDIPVPSPTFTLMQLYDSPKGKIIHLDLYRCSDPSETDELGLEELFDSAVIFVEWPNNGNLPEDRINLYFNRLENKLKISSDFSF